MAGKSEILEQALRIAREGIESLSKSKGKTPQELLGGFANQKPRVPFEEWRYEYEPTTELLPTKEFDPATMRPGDVIIPLVGDRTSTGRKITSVAGEKLETPAITEGGPDYMRGPSQQEDQSVWASGKGVISGLNRRIENALRASEAMGYREPTVYGSYVAMGPQSGDFSTHTAETVMGMMPNAKIKRADVKEFDQRMKEKFKDWPGLMSPNAADYVVNAAAGEHRKAFLDTMDSAYWRDKGFPDVSLARYATTTPELISSPTEAAGYGIAKITPGIKPDIVTVPHRSYPATMQGEYAGSFPEGLQRDDIFTQFSRAFDENPPERNYVAAKRRSFGMDPNAYQVMDEPEIQALIDKVNKIKSGYADGGEVDDDIHDALRIAKDIGGGTSPAVMMEDAKGNKYDAQGNVILPTITGPNPQRSEMTPQEIGARAAEDAATFDAFMRKYAVPDQDIMRYEQTQRAVAQQPYETQQMTHVGAPPMRDVRVDAPLLGGEYNLGQAPYNVAGPMSTAAQTAYDLKTAPFYFVPATAPFAAATDVAEGVATGDPLQASLAALGTPGKMTKAAVIGLSNYAMDPAQAQAGPERWFSKALELAREIPMKKMTGEQALAMLRKGTSPEELRWMNVEPFLQGQKQVTKEDLVNYLEKNRFQPKEITLGGNRPTDLRNIMLQDIPKQISDKYMPKYNALIDKKINVSSEIKKIKDTGKAIGNPQYIKLMEEQQAIYKQMDEISNNMRQEYVDSIGGLARPTKYGPDKFSTNPLHTEGSTGYQENIFTMPISGRPKVVQRNGLWDVVDESGNTIKSEKGSPYSYWSEGDANRAAASLYRRSGSYTSPHWDEPDVLLHTRTETLESTPPGANRPYKVHNVTESQSDLGQAGRERGFKDQEAMAAVARLRQETHDLNDKLSDEMRNLRQEHYENIWPFREAQNAYDDQLRQKYKSGEISRGEMNHLANQYEFTVREQMAPFLEQYKLKENNIIKPLREQIVAKEAEILRIGKNIGEMPLMPYVANTNAWTDFGIKKELDRALDSDADYFSWTPGDVHADRYSLDKQINVLQYDTTDNTLRAYDKDGWSVVHETVPPDKLEDYVGKEMAEKLMSQADDEGLRTLQGLDLKTGGEGMRGYYDKVYPKRVQEVLRKATGMRVPIEEITVNTANGPRKQFGIRLTDEIREKARFSDFNRGGTVTETPAYGNDDAVNRAIALTSEY